MGLDIVGSAAFNAKAEEVAMKVKAALKSTIGAAAQAGVR